MDIYNFRKELNKVEQIEPQLIGRLQLDFPGATIEKASLADDKAGIDYWLNFPNGKIKVDAKIRWEDHPDLALETWSVWNPIKKRKIGWTGDEQKQTDLIWWWWVPADRTFTIPYKPLRDAYRENIDEWRDTYWTAKQSNAGYVSECIFVDRLVVARATRAQAGFSAEMKRLGVIIK